MRRLLLPLLLIVGALLAPAGQAAVRQEDAPLEPPSLARLQPGINAAIDRGAEHLLHEQLRDGSWRSHTGDYRNGQTALCAYALLKSGISRDHPALRRALSYLRRELPTRTYDAGVQLLLLKALDDQELLPWARELSELLVDWENSEERGSWGYPHGRSDLSNTQIAALGMWAGVHLGLKPDRSVWKRLVESTLERFQAPDDEVPWDGAGRTGKRLIAGFTYYTNGDGDPPTGSMTTGGLCVLAVGEDVLGKDLGGRLQRRVDEAQNLGLGWLAHHFSVETNPGTETGANHYYYLYGLERVGGLYGLEELGGQPWYRAGADVLLRKQEGNGSWGGEDQTCFALLFLARATHPSTGPAPSGGAEVQVSSEGELHLKAMVKEDVVLFVDGFSEEALASPLAPTGQGLRVLAVEYFVDGELVERVEADPARAWNGERFPARYQPGLPAVREFMARALVVPPGVDPALGAEPRVLESVPMKFRVEESSSAWLTRMASFDRENLLRTASVAELLISSKDADWQLPELLLDGREGTHWRCGREDPEPWLRVSLERPVRATGVSLTPAAAGRGQVRDFDRLVRVSVRVNREDPITVELSQDGDPLEPILVPLAKRTRVRQLEVRILERRALGDALRGTGFAEVGLYDQ